MNTINTFDHRALKYLSAFIIICLLSIPTKSNAQGTCAGLCNVGGNFGGCYCIADCWLWGDCCPDICYYCNTNPPSPPGVCGSYSCGTTPFIEPGVTQGVTPQCGSGSSWNVGPGTHTRFSVVQGVTYTFSTCGSSWDTQISGYHIVSPGSNVRLLFFNDDACGLQSQVTWTADYTGTLYVAIHRYNCRGYGTSGGASAVLTYKAEGTVGRWSGNVDTRWELPGNWECGIVPTTSTNVVIPNRPNDPTIGSGVVGNCYTITIESDAGADLNITGTGVLNVTKP